ncbi:MAG: TetR/AcrR family transcriptional regulator [Alphaproteobacteria bacterium]|nr:TetR/AcrR family transcriptional regulator [Alphaproteobacteria bacterium]
MPRPRWSRLEPEQQARILEAATAEFAARGFHEASFNRILSEAGVSKGAAYYYFDDKEDLFLTLVEARVGGAVQEVVQELELPDADFWAWSEHLTMAVFGAFAGDPRNVALGREFYALLGGGRSARAAALWAGVSAWIQTLLERGQALGAVRTDLPLDLLAALTLGLGEAMDRWGFQAAEAPGASLEDLMPLMGAATDLFKRLLAPPLRDEAAQRPGWDS